MKIFIISKRMYNILGTMVMSVMFLALISILLPLSQSINEKNNIISKPEIITELTTELAEEKESTFISEEESTSSTEIKIEDIYHKIDKEVSAIPYDFFLEKYEWFKEYKKIIDKYPKAMFVTIYDVFTKEELDLLFRVVQAEVGDYDFMSEANVASVILNRHYYYKTDLTSILLAEYQFATITNGMYLKVEVDEETILACEYVFLFGDTTNGAMFFDSTNGNSWAAHNREFIFRDSAGHDFYK